MEIKNPSTQPPFPNYLSTNLQSAAFATMKGGSIWEIVQTAETLWICHLCFVVLTDLPKQYRNFKRNAKWVLLRGYRTIRLHSHAQG
jgi:hypothetical protein